MDKYHLSDKFNRDEKLFSRKKKESVNKMIDEDYLEEHEELKKRRP